MVIGGKLIMYNSNLAHETIIKPRGKSYDIRHTIERRLTRDKKAAYTKMVLVALVVILGAMSILMRNVANTEIGNRVKQLKEEHTLLCTENQKKEVEIGKKVDLKAVEELAVSSYGMNRAKKEQIVHININGQDYGVVAANIKDRDSDKNFNVFAMIMEYFR